MDYEQIRTALPAFLEPALEADYGASLTRRIVEGYGSQRPTTLRANTLKADNAAIAAALNEAGFGYERVSWYDDAFILEENPDVSLWDTAFLKKGEVYVQSLSSLLPPLFMELAPNLDVLDMCAAPGGKTTQIAALGKGQLHVTACEQSPVRADKLCFNLEKQGARNVTVMRQDARKLDSFFSFDRVLLDAPCSGSGTLRAQDPKLAKHFSQNLVKDSCKKQQALLAKALEVVKPGGILIYSTCSVLKCENENIVSEALKKAAKKGSYQLCSLSDSIPEDIPLLPSTIDGCITVCPTELFEGFFMCKIKRFA